jgi:hypothetical protein
MANLATSPQKYYRQGLCGRSEVSKQQYYASMGPRDVRFVQYVGREPHLFTDEQLISEYKSGMKHCFGIHSVNARKAQDLMAEELFARGVDSFPTLFGPIEICNRWSKGGAV